MIDWFAVLFCLLLGPCDNRACHSFEHMKKPYLVCSYPTTDVSVRTFLDDADGKPYGRLRRLEKDLDAKEKQPLLLMNGGMYHEDLSAVGLYVEHGKKHQNISTKGGWGNFHLLPNGVFWEKNGRLGVTETGAFLRQNIKPHFATQSGPMLVINGKLHPRFLRHSDSLKIRNGVGVSKDGQRVYFALSREPVSFWAFGTLFRDELETPNALFLDGSVSSLRAEDYRLEGWRELGPMIGVFARPESGD